MAVALVAGATLVGVGPTQAQTAAEEEEFEPGSGRSDARVLRVGPSSAQLALAPSFALSLADFLGTQGRGESRAIEYAALEGSVHDAEDDYLGQRLLTETIFPHVRITNTDANAAEGRSGEHPPFSQFAKAGNAPSGESITHLARIEIPGVVSIAGGRAHSWAGLAERNGAPIRVAGGAVDIARVNLGGGAVVLDGLHWDVLQTTDKNEDPEPEVTGNFVIGRAMMGGETIQGPITGAELEALFGPINEALAPVGLVLDAPHLAVLQGTATMTPLAVRIINSQAGNAVLGPLLGNLQDLRAPITDAIVEAGGATAVLLADVLVGVLSGAGRLDIELGGAFAYTEGELFPEDDVDLGEVLDDAFEPIPEVPGGFVEFLPGSTTTFTEEVGLGSGATRPPAAIAQSGPLGSRNSLASALWALAVFVFGVLMAMLLNAYRRARARILEIPI